MLIKPDFGPKQVILVQMGLTYQTKDHFSWLQCTM